MAAGIKCMQVWYKSSLGMSYEAGSSMMSADVADTWLAMQDIDKVIQGGVYSMVSDRYCGLRCREIVSSSSQGTSCQSGEIITTSESGCRQPRGQCGCVRS